MNDLLIKIEYTPHSESKDNWIPDGCIKVLTTDLSQVISEDNLPLILSVENIKGDEVWGCKLNSFCWGAYNEICYKKIKVKTSKGLDLIKWEWDVFQHGDICHQIFQIWALNNKGSKGLAIGTHDGTSGEWVGPVFSDILEAVLVEPSDKQYSVLESIYEKKPLVKLEKALVTPNGGDIDFYEGGNGTTNSVNREHTLQYYDNLNVVRYKSVTLRNLLDKYHIGNDKWWLHLDVEGLDDELLLTLDYSNINLPSCLVFEHEGLTEERSNRIQIWLDERRYSCNKSARNTICILNN